MKILIKLSEKRHIDTYPKTFQNEISTFQIKKEPTQNDLRAVPSCTPQHTPTSKGTHGPHSQVLITRISWIIRRIRFRLRIRAELARETSSPCNNRSLCTAGTWISTLISPCAVPSVCVRGLEVAALTIHFDSRPVDEGLTVLIVNGMPNRAKG